MRRLLDILVLVGGLAVAGYLAKTFMSVDVVGEADLGIEEGSSSAQPQRQAVETEAERRQREADRAHEEWRRRRQQRNGDVPSQIPESMRRQLEAEGIRPDRLRTTPERATRPPVRPMDDSFGRSNQSLEQLEQIERWCSLTENRASPRCKNIRQENRDAQARQR